MKTKKIKAKCPNCGKRAGLRARFDAYADHFIIIDKKTMVMEFKYEDCVSFEHTVYECFNCNSETSENEILEYNFQEVK